MSRGYAEQETIFRWDRQEKVLWANTTAPRTAEKWTRRGYDVRVIGHVDGISASWAVRLPFTQRRAWIRLFGLSVPSFTTDEEADGESADPACGGADE